MKRWTILQSFLTPSSSQRTADYLWTTLHPRSPVHPFQNKFGVIGSTALHPNTTALILHSERIRATQYDLKDQILINSGKQNSSSVFRALSESGSVLHSGTLRSPDGPPEGMSLERLINRIDWDCFRCVAMYVISLAKVLLANVL